MNYYAGMDVSLEETAVCVVDEQGRIVKELQRFDLSKTGDDIKGLAFE